MLLNNISEFESFQRLKEAFQKQDSVLIENLWNAPKAFITSLAQNVANKHILIITAASTEENRLFHDFAFFGDCPVIDFPAWETLPNEDFSPSPDIVGDRYKVLESLLSNKKPHIIISNWQACLQGLISPKTFQSLHLSLKVGTKFEFDLLILQLEEMGYQKRTVASDKGEYAVRGGIIDVFPVSSPDPFRLEFWGDEIEVIKIYDPIGQKSVKPAEEVTITAAQERELWKQGKISSILDYLGPETLIVFDDLLALEDRYSALVNNMGNTSIQAFSNIDTFLSAIEPLSKIFLSAQPIEELANIRFLDSAEMKSTNFYSKNAPLHSLEFEMFSRPLRAKRWNHPFKRISAFLQHDDEEAEDLSGDELLLALRNIPKDSNVHVLCATESEQLNFDKKLKDLGIHLPHKTHFHRAYLSNGFAIENDPSIVIIPMAEFTHRYKIRRQKQRSTYHTAPAEVFDLTPGEIIVHLSQGIGKYIGMEKRANHLGIQSEFFVLEYAEGAKFYVPMHQAYMISKYIGAHEEIPTLHNLGSNRWKKTREQTEIAIKGYASDLLKFYAQRAVVEGFACPEDSEFMRAFEDEFPYVETEDQLSAIAQIKGDLCSKKVMDRLVCGDVGYGKTEVAMRAAFKAVVDGRKQVAVLVPTTVLATQHYETFVERMSNFPINIAVLSRLKSAKETREILEKTANGGIDILVGTHRIISDDVVFKDLGLVIIDEEQRFGVKAKEHLKKIKAAVDCLTLSATPIPRTLYMSLIGARDMSVINTPPQDRLPIKTIISETNDQILKTALLRELNRDGQAFVIHNRVETIDEMGSRIKKLLPQARIGIVHGQMDVDDSNEIFHLFKNGLCDILIATTIVENGIDIPNANTILVDRADRFGMSDLYQLRGRVGRWNRRAYAYFMVPNQRVLTELSRKRLLALAESSGYGGGMKLAMRDLEIRGAGDLLGVEQSGHVAAVGFHFYCKMLKRAMKELQGQTVVSIYDTKIEFPFDARLTETFIEETSLRMEIYYRLGEAVSFADVDSILEEIIDRFGKPPEQVYWLYHITRIRVYAALNGFTLLKLESNGQTLFVERQIGKDAKNVMVKHIPFVKPKAPKELEDKVIALLKTL